MHKLYELWSDDNIMETNEKDLSAIIYIILMITIFIIAI